MSLRRLATASHCDGYFNYQIDETCVESIPLSTSTEPSPVVNDSPAAVKPRPALLPFHALLSQLELDSIRLHKAQATGQPLGPVTGLRELDRTLGRALTPGVHIVHGSPGVGKTAFALQVAATCGCPALYVTCEMHPIELLRRHTARVTRTFLGDLKSGELEPDKVMSLARRAAGAAPLLGILDATEAAAPVGELKTAAETTRNQGAAGPDSHLLIVIDSLHSWADNLGQNDIQEYDRLNEALADLRKLAKVLNCPVLAISERNRGSMKAGGQSAGAGTRKIEYGAETVLELDAKEDAKPDVEGDIEISLRISKNRNGSVGRPINLKFTGRLQNYKETDSQGGGF